MALVASVGSLDEALHTLQGSGLIRIEYGGVRVLDLDGLQRQVFHG